MTNSKKSHAEILAKLGIKKLNAMQEDTLAAASESETLLLLSPTGTGKTLAFLLPLLSRLDGKKQGVQALILVPSRELAIQIEQVIRNAGTGFKAIAAYGGQSFSKDKEALKNPPSILIGTAGRIADHIRRESFACGAIHTLVLDEFDKSLEVGFERDMKEIIAALPRVSFTMLTSATKDKALPAFVGVKNPTLVNYLDVNESELRKKLHTSKSDDKRAALVELLCHTGNNNGIIFCNFKESVSKVSAYLKEQKISHGCFFGGMEQVDRERALIKFRNGTHQLIVATDLASRGLDIPELKFIIHYELPNRAEEFTHRNGRTARMGKDGTAFILKAPNERLPEFVGKIEELRLRSAKPPQASDWQTVFVSGGRKDKISKGDIAGLCFKQGKCGKNDVGIIELKNDCAFVAIKADKVKRLIKEVNNTKLKTKKVRVYLV